MHIQHVVIEGIKGFGWGAKRLELDLRRPDGSLAGWTVFAGRNGSGKTTLLKCLALGAVSSQAVATLLPSAAGWRNIAARDADAALIELRFDIAVIDKRSPSLLMNCERLRVEKRLQGGPDSTFRETAMQVWPDVPMNDEIKHDFYLNAEELIQDTHGYFVAGYGPQRRLSGHASDAQRLMAQTGQAGRLVSLFREDASLVEAVTWLKEVYVRRLEGKSGAEDLEKNVLLLLQDGLLPAGLIVQGIDSEGLWVARSGVRLSLSDLSDGYRTTAALVLDLVRQLYNCFDGFTLERVEDTWTVPYPGVVLIDEVESHLHVSWQQKIGFWFKKHFPNIQFIVTTHSPFICQAADPGGIFRLPTPGDEQPPARVSDDDYRTIVNGNIDEAVLTGLFGLEYPHSSHAEELRRRVAALDTKVASGQASAAEQRQLEALSEQLPNTNAQLVDRALRQLGVRQ